MKEGSLGTRKKAKSSTDKYSEDNLEALTIQSNMDKLLKASSC